VSVAVREARDPREVDAALDLRTAVFVGEQGVTPEEEFDGRDGEALHLVAVQEDGTVVGTCRLLSAGDTVKLGRMAVAPPARGRGVALALLEEADARARAGGAARIRLASQTAVTGLYERAGYVAYGDVFLDAGIDHVWMEKRLA
jgi:predicted GNAT family N-acyltransferase